MMTEPLLPVIDNVPPTLIDDKLMGPTASRNAAEPAPVVTLSDVKSFAWLSRLMAPPPVSMIATLVSVIAPVCPNVPPLVLITAEDDLNAGRLSAALFV